MTKQYNYYTTKQNKYCATKQNNYYTIEQYNFNVTKQYIFYATKQYHQSISLINYINRHHLSKDFDAHHVIKQVCFQI